MNMPGKKRILKLLTFGVLLASLDASAGVIRHDRSDVLYTNLGNSIQYNGVGDMLINSSTSRCSATTLNANWVLTAAHCVDGGTTDVNFTVGGTTYFADNWYVHANWVNAVSTLGSNVALTTGWDIALVQFTTDITGVNFANLYSGSSELGEIGTNVGFGRTGTGLTGDTLASGTKRGGNSVIDVTGSAIGWSSQILLQDFDNPDDATDNAFGSAVPLNLEYQIAPGDSGGGLFATIGGTEYLVGVHSFIASTDGNTNSDYGDISGSTRVSSFTDWISDIIGANSGGQVPLPGSIVLMGLGLLMFRAHRQQQV